MSDKTDLDGLPDEIWGELVEACANPGDPMHTPAVATVNCGVAAVRSVVLRAVDPERRILEFHTDSRSPKAADLRRDPNLSWLFYEPDEMIQVRAESVATLYHVDEVCREAWKTVPAETKSYYMLETLPGAEISEPVEHPTVDHAAAHPDDGFGNFLVVRAEVTAFDWLCLGPDKHRRAIVRFTEDGIRCAWVAP